MPDRGAEARPPSVDSLARGLSDLELPHPLLVDAARAAIAAGDPESARVRALGLQSQLLRPVVNATGILLHTNLGRAPCSPHREVGRYSNLELDLATGRRGSRGDHAAALIARAAGAEAALVVNNGAAAVLLALVTVASGRSVVVSRGELVEIGGGFRVPEVMASSGARLVEVGTTNRTRLDDYAGVIANGEDVAAVLKVHQSNYRIVGFTEAVEVEALARLGPPVIYDLGSGLLDTTAPWLKGGPPRWLAGEPAVRQSLAAGAALVTFSGDKLFGGPQAGIIAGRSDLVAACARHPLARALRAGSLVLEALQETALAYLRRDGSAIAFWRMATTPVGELRSRAKEIAEKTSGLAQVVETTAFAGAGSLPGLEIESAGVACEGDISMTLRRFDPPVVARVHGGMTICDLRAVDPRDDLVIAAVLSSTTGETHWHT